MTNTQTTTSVRSLQSDTVVCVCACVWLLDGLLCGKQQCVGNRSRSHRFSSQCENFGFAFHTCQLLTSDEPFVHQTIQLFARPSVQWSHERRQKRTVAYASEDTLPEYAAIQTDRARFRCARYIYEECLRLTHLFIHVRIARRWYAWHACERGESVRRDVIEYTDEFN